MKFEVIIDGEIRQFELYHDALAYINERMAYWNNFEGHTAFQVTVQKVPDGTQTLGVNVGEKIDVRAVFGG